MPRRYLAWLGAGFLGVGAVSAGSGCGDDPPPADDGGGGATASSTSTGSGATSSSVGSSSSSGGGSEPIVCGSEYTNVTGSCDLLNQDCASGQMCNVQNGEAQCLPDPGGLKKHGDPCTSPSECQRGLVCIDSKCAPFCCPDNDQPCEGGVCDLQVNLGDGDFVFVCSYAEACTLFAGDCPEGMDCHIANADKGLSVCDPPLDLVAEGEACNFRNNCDDAQQCVGNVCRHNCNLATWNVDPRPAPGAGGCLAERECVDLMASAFPGIGLCAPIEQ